MNPHKNRELFSSFPVIDKEFDLVFVDAVKFVGDDNEESFVPIIRYVMKNKENRTIDAGFTLRTGAILESIDDVSKFVNTVVGVRFFAVDVSALGTIYNEKMESIQDVDWNDIIAKSKEFSDYEPEEKQYLH
jgi:hypothetical protein